MNWLRRLWRRLNEPAVEQAAIGNFTPRAQQVLALARREADRLHHGVVDAEHLLLALAGFGKGVAAEVLRHRVVNLESLRTEIECQCAAVPAAASSGLVSFSDRVKRVLALSQKEARALGHTYVGTEHILLGLLHEGKGDAVHALKRFGLVLDQTRKDILRELDPNFGISVEGVEGQSQS
jgi:ATP-dependent Clp protease ATP-binding subunit ClpC